MAGVPIHGKVVETGTLKPIAGAIVTARWQGIKPAPGHGVHACIHVETTMTNEKGEFRIPGWVGAPQYIAEVETTIDAYKPGYGFPEVPSPKDEIVWLTPFKGTKGERLAQLQRSVVSCHQAGDSKKNLLPLIKAIYEEARGLPQTPSDSKIVNNLLFTLEIIDLGYEVAERRDIERSRGQK